MAEPEKLKHAEQRTRPEYGIKITLIKLQNDKQLPAFLKNPVSVCEWKMAAKKICRCVRSYLTTTISGGIAGVWVSLHLKHYFQNTDSKILMLFFYQQILAVRHLLVVDLEHADCQDPLRVNAD